MNHRVLAIGLGVLLAFATLAGAQTWTPLTHQPTFYAGSPLLLTDGTVMVQALTSVGYGTGKWWRLTPDNTGSYINGTWSQLASMPSGYAPAGYAAAVLPDGRVVVEGGEYNSTQEAETNLGAIYNPTNNSWTPIQAPSGWSHIGDAQSAVLANGTFMLGNCGETGSECTHEKQQALLNASTLTWTITGGGKADQNSEEGWTLLPNGKVLTVDVWNGTQSELYNPSTGGWSLAGRTGVQLVNTACAEIGPAVLRPQGNVFAAGGISFTAIYNPSSGTWTAGPSFPSGLGVSDGPAAVLPDGNVLVDASPIPFPGSPPPPPTKLWYGSGCIYKSGSEFFEYNGTSLTSVPGPTNAPSDVSVQGSMLVLPTGQILFTDWSMQVEVYTANGTYQSAWQPTITSAPSTVSLGITNYMIGGTQFNGLSQGAMYGDDVQMATNYPLVRITNNATGHKFYAKTHDHSTMGVATGAAGVSTYFDVPVNVETGPSTLVVLANGIPSKPVSVTVNTSVTILTTQTPTTITSAAGYEIANRFTSSQNGYITALRFYKVAGEPGPHTLRLWSDTGTLLASVTTSNESSSGWQEQSLSPPVAITANTNYRVSYTEHVQCGKTMNAFSNGATISNPPLTANKGYYGSTGGAFPTTASDSNMFADIRFHP